MEKGGALFKRLKIDNSIGWAAVFLKRGSNYLANQFISVELYRNFNGKMSHKLAMDIALMIRVDLENISKVKGLKNKLLEKLINMDFFEKIIKNENQIFIEDFIKEDENQTEWKKGVEKFFESYLIANILNLDFYKIEFLFDY